MKRVPTRRTAVAAMLALGCASDGLPSAGAVPPPPEQFAADCLAPTYASDVVVCGDEALLAMDRELRRLYEPLREALEATSAASMLDTHALVETQDAWFRRRSLCAFSERQVDCLRAAYEERLRVLGALALHRAQPSPEVLFAVCRDAPWGLEKTGISATQLGEIVLTAPSGRVLAVAVGGPLLDDWTPYLRHEADGSQLRLFPLEGPIVTCELRQPQSGRP